MVLFMAPAINQSSSLGRFKVSSYCILPVNSHGYYKFQVETGAAILYQKYM